ncbi:hypothetical protein L1987_84316 [Smallanthus sonchifolius]|uniref:Uncharacterized protein n=1 Tax=Smallanthus sonchifolius TaxID=185202 RepID=A0ACB8YF28_9ASTR|nr:hypothetical protein L1987_84316 [Smallanthus sonchifolius]
MASSSVSLHFLPLPSSKTLSVLSQTIFPASLRIFPSTPNRLFEATPSSRFVTKVVVSPDLSTGVDEELELDFSPELKLFVGNLPFHVDNAALALLFEQSGHVETAEVVYDKLNRRSRGFAFVKMSSVKEAEAAAKKFDGYELYGRQLKVNYGPPPRKKSFIKKPRDHETSENNTNNVVYVGNLSWNVDNETLETLFWEHGNVMQAKVFYDKDSGRSRGFGFVTYSCADEVYSAVKSLDGVDLDGRNIQVSVAVPPQRRQP